jgi:hypothetical protein
MKTLEERFGELTIRNPAWSDYLCLSNAVIGKGLTYYEIKTAFDTLVHRSEYSQHDKEEIIQDLYQKNLSGFA